MVLHRWIVLAANDGRPGTTRGRLSPPPRVTV